VLFVVVVAAIVAITPIIVISRQKLARARSQADLAKTSSVNSSESNNARTFIKTRMAGQDVQIDTQSGEIKPLTAQEAEKLATGLASMLDDSTDGLVKVRHGDGSVSMDLQDHFQNVTVARVTSDGTIEQSCVDNPRAAAKFFRIDQKLMEKASANRHKVKPY
jgi:hypothetical protein